MLWGTIASLMLSLSMCYAFASKKFLRNVSFLLLPDSLLEIKGEAHHQWPYAILARTTDLVQGHKSQQKRLISLTFRQMRCEH